MIKHVFWDFNGTILDDRVLCFNLLNDLLAFEGKAPITFNRYLEVFGFPIKDYYKKAGITFKNKSFLEMSDWFIETYQPLSLKESLYEGVEETLRKLNKRGINNVCLSASEENNLKEQLTHFKIIKYFKAVLGNNNVLAVGKLDVAKNYLTDNNINPKECLLIGDTIYDYELAKELGFTAVLFTEGHQSKELLIATGSMTVDKIKDLIKIIERKRKL